MLKELRRQLPEYEIIKDGPLFLFKRRTKDGGVVSIPLLKGEVDWMVNVIKTAWEENYA